MSFSSLTRNLSDLVKASDMRRHYYYFHLREKTDTSVEFPAEIQQLSEAAAAAQGSLRAGKAGLKKHRQPRPTAQQELQWGPRTPAGVFNCRSGQGGLAGERAFTALPGLSPAAAPPLTATGRRRPIHVLDARGDANRRDVAVAGRVSLRRCPSWVLWAAGWGRLSLCRRPSRMDDPTWAAC